MIERTRVRARQARSVALRASRAALVAASRRAHPIEDGRMRLAGLGAPVEVIRDRFGVPHIYAASARDAFFGQGFVHAQDRLFQMDSMRRAGQGRIAEWAGAPAIEADRFLRRLGFADIAARDLAACGDAERALLGAYTAGVNAAIATLPALPPEYAFVDGAPEPWLSEHTMLLGRFVLFAFAPNWDTELLRERLLRALGPERAAALEPVTPPTARTATGAPTGTAERIFEAYRAAVGLGMPGGGGSNAWAVTSAHTTTSAPLLASDPHLESRMPGLLHMSHIVGGEFDVIGAGVAGIPLVAMGHNRDVAWGITAGMADVADCYIETVDPADPKRYLAPDGWHTGRTRIERIEVRDAPPVIEHVLETRHGPVIGTVLPGETRAIALRSTALESGDPLTPVLAMDRARGIEELDAAIGRRPGATFSYVFASRDGRIGYRMSGNVLRHQAGEGLLPRDGATAPDPLPPFAEDELPHRLDPPDGVLVTSNNAPGWPTELGEDWCESARAERIAELIAARPTHDIGSFAAIQQDRRSALLLRVRVLLDGVAALDGAPRAHISAWDGSVEVNSAAPAILESVVREAGRILAQRAAGAEASVLLGSGVGAATAASSFGYRAQGWIVRALEAAAPPYCQDAADRDRVLRTASQRAIEALRTRLGPDPARWRWGDLHHWRLPHALDAVFGLGKWFSRGPYPFPGDVNTVLQGGMTLARDTDTVGILPGYRQIIDLADFDRSVFILSTGNSGIPGHPRYGDCIEEFREGQYRPLLYTRAVVQAHTEHTLTLEPA